MSFTQQLARASALHPWRILGIWAIVLVASVASIVTLLGSALSTDADITTRPDSVQARDLLAASFTQRNQIDEAVIVYSADLAAKGSAFKAFVSELTSSIQGTGSTRKVYNPSTCFRALTGRRSLGAAVSA